MSIYGFMRAIFSKKHREVNGPIDADLVHCSCGKPDCKILFKRKRKEDINYPIGDWRWSGGGMIFKDYDYWCPKCGTKLTDGPRGGLAVNAVCVTCKINYGCLPGYNGG